MVEMIVIGADTHKASHTVGAVDAATGRVIADLTVRAKRRSFDDVLLWVRGLDEGERVWAIEDCRHVSGALERFLLARGERVVRVPPKLMAGQRLDPEPRRERRYHHDPCAADDPLVVELDLHAVQSDQLVIVHHEGDLLTAGPGCHEQP